MTQLVRHQPWWLAGLERQVDELFGTLPVRYGSWVVPAAPGRWAPPCEVLSRDGDLVVELDLPGIDPDKDVQVTVRDGILCITGERHRPDTGDGGDGGVAWREWRYGPFERGFTLPEGATGEGITASYRNGVLEVVVPKAAQRAEPRQIPVSTGAGKNGQAALTASQGAA
jgi:HSP20 family protein